MDTIILEGYYPFSETVNVDSHRLDKKVFKLYTKRHLIKNLSRVPLRRVYVDFLSAIDVYGVVDLSEKGYLPFFVTSATLDKIKDSQK
jgi:hypothetical protein